jgi:hypothetical protein
VAHLLEVYRASPPDNSDQEASPDVSDQEASPEVADQARVLRWMRVFIFAILMASAFVAIALELWSNISLFDLFYVAMTAQIALIGPVIAVLWFAPRGPSRSLGLFGALAISAGLLFGVGTCLYFIITKQSGLVYWGPICAVLFSTLLVLPTWGHWKRLPAPEPDHKNGAPE